MVESIYDRINDYGSVRITLASPNDIRSWSFGEVASRKRSTIEPIGRKKTACSANASLARNGTGSAPVVSIRGPSSKASSVTVAA